MIRTHNDGILERYGTFVVATPRNFPLVHTEPFGLTLRWHIDPMRTSSATFVDLLQRLDALTFGPEGMPMDKWVFYNCAELPGFLYGFAAAAEELTRHEREVYGVPSSYDGPVPLSMYIAMPMYERGSWFGHNLASLNRTFPERDLHHLGTMTKAIALEAFRVERFVGATQWSSKALYIHTKFGPLDIQTAYTPAHSIPETLTYAFDVTDTCLRAALGDPEATVDRPAANLFVDSRDVDTMRSMQAAIEGGARYVLAGPPAQRGDHMEHPVYETELS